MVEGVGQLSRSQGYDWSAAHMKLLLYGCEPVTYQQQFGMIFDWIRVLGVRHPALGTNAKLRIG